MRKISFENNEYYHVYNRGVDKRDIFLEDWDYARLIKYIKEIVLYESNNNTKKSVITLINSVELICYCFNPNHYHFILRQLRNNGISDFMHYLGTSYTMFFNAKYKRTGSLLQGPFKAKHIDSEEYLFWLSVYVNGNPHIHNYIDKAENYFWSSYREYLGIKKQNYLCKKEVILNGISKAEYQKTVKNGIPEIQERKMAKYLLE